MAKFMTFKTTKNLSIAVNMDHVRCIEPHGRLGSILRLDGENISVTENPEEIAARKEWQTP